MILVSLALLGFAVTDLIRWSPDPVGRNRAALAVGGGTGSCLLLSGLGGYSWSGVLIIGLAVLVVLAVWVTSDQWAVGKPGYPLAWVCVVLVAAFGSGDLAGEISGSVARWYADLAFPFVDSMAVDQFVLGTGACLFLLASANRFVRHVLEAAGTLPKPDAIEGEENDPAATLRGGRVLGPMERLFVAGLVLSGEMTGAAIVIAAKGLLRLPEIRDSAAQKAGRDDHVTEYFLIGTFTSLLLAGVMSALVLAAS